MSMSADDRKTLGSMLQFYVDTGDSLRHVPNPATLYSGALAVSAISAIGVATFTAIATPLQKGQQFFYLGVTYTIQANTVPADTTVSVLPRPGTALATVVASTQVFTPLNITNNGLGETNNVISKSSLFNPRDG
jgi:hypothetical protein